MLHFRSNANKDYPLVIDIPLGFVSRVEKVGGQRTSAENAYGLEIFCKDIRSLRFALNKMDAANHHPRKDIFETIRLFSFPHTYNKPMFAFEFQDKYHDHLRYHSYITYSTKPNLTSKILNWIFSSNQK